MFVNSLHVLFTWAVSLIPGLGEHQAGTKQPCHLPGSPHEPPAAHGLPEQEEAAPTEERRELKERIGRRRRKQLLRVGPLPRLRKKGWILQSCRRFNYFVPFGRSIRTRVTLSLNLQPSALIFVWGEKRPKKSERSDSELLLFGKKNQHPNVFLSQTLMVEMIQKKQVMCSPPSAVVSSENGDGHLLYYINCYLSLNLYKNVRLTQSFKNYQLILFNL